MGTPIELHEVQRPGRAVSDVLRPTSITVALAMLADVEGARPIAGGTDLLLELQRNGPGPAVPLIDLTGIEGFARIAESESAEGGEGDETEFVLGGGVTHNQIVLHEGIREHALPLAQACLEIGSPQLRNRATIAGNLVTASPANDSISALMALGARVEVARLAGDRVDTRTVPLVDFFTGFRRTVLEPDELIVEIRVPRLAPTEQGIWVKLGLRRAQAISVVHGACVVGVEDDVVVSARLALGSVAPTVVMIEPFADALVGRPLDETSIAAAAQAAVDAIAPIDDVRGTADYRNATVATLVERSLRTLVAGEQASMWPADPPALATPDQLSAAASVPVTHVSATMSATVNGVEVAAGKPTSSLLDWLRDEASGREAGLLSGVKEGCAEGECGACTVLVDGAAVMSCLVVAGQADGATIVTVEGLAGDNGLHPIQDTFIADFAVQCGFCIPGFLVSGARLLDENSQPTDEQIRLALSGNLCRCTGYYPIVEAVRDAGRALR